MSSEQKQTQNRKKKFEKIFLCVETKNDEGHSDSKFYYCEEHETAEES